MVRRIVCFVVSLLVPLAVLTAPSAHASTDGASYHPKLSEKCAVRHERPKKVVEARVFAACVTKAMKRASTVQFRDKVDDAWLTGPMRFTKESTDFAAKVNNGDRLVVLGKRAWFKEKARRRWVKGDRNGTDREQDAFWYRKLHLEMVSVQAHLDLLRSSAAGWAPTGEKRRMNGVKAREYTGGRDYYGNGTRTGRYSVWVDRFDRPIRMTLVDNYPTGFTSTERRNFKAWGEAVRIRAPKRR